MLSKMKLAAEVRHLASPAAAKADDQEREEEEEEEEQEDEEASSASDSDSNNNNKSKDLNKTTPTTTTNATSEAAPTTTLDQPHQEAPEPEAVDCTNESSRDKSQEELLDIVEVSKKRRISKDSADCLSSFIRWSFSNAQVAEKRMRREASRPASLQDDQERLPEDEDADADVESHSHSQELDDDQDDDAEDEPEVAKSWPAHANNSKLRQLVKRKKQEEQEEDIESSAENLALLKSGLSSLIAEQTRAQKRVRNHLYQQHQHQHHNQTLDLHRPNPNHATHLLAGSRKAQLLANPFIDRSQQQQQHQVMRNLEPPEEANSAAAAAAAAAAASALSYHLQQMLQQPNPSLDELCSQVGLDPTDTSQLVLAAALHKSQFEQSSTGGSGSSSKMADSKSSVSSTTSANSLASSNHNNNNNNHLPSLQQQQQQLLQQAASSLLGADSVASQQRLHLQLEAERQRLRQRMLQGSLPDSGGRLHQQAASSLAAAAGRQQQQQQRHAQAAAALSALASASSTALQQQHQFAPAGPQPPAPPPLDLNSFIHPALNHGSLPGGLHLGALAAAAAAGAAAAGAGPNHQQIVDFKCDTCPSSFDDRHRLMQHQSIHLELKKDWFTETPVEAVMKIFNRRRGEFLCNICNLRFEATLDYDQHNHSVHGLRPYCCQFCGNGTRTFRCWRQYLNHLYDHRYIFSCTIGNCDFTVNRRDSLRFHIFRFHLNCQLPQNQQHQQLHHPLSLAPGRPRSRAGLLEGGAASAAELNKWNSANSDDSDPLPADSDHHHHHNHNHHRHIDAADSDDDDNTDNEMNVAD